MAAPPKHTIKLTYLDTSDADKGNWTVEAVDIPDSDLNDVYFIEVRGLDQFTEIVQVYAEVYANKGSVPAKCPSDLDWTTAGTPVIDPHNLRWGYQFLKDPTSFQAVKIRNIGVQNWLQVWAKFDGDDTFYTALNGPLAFTPVTV